MSQKATVRAPSNIALIKYWGARDLERAVPRNPSISMTLERCVSRSTVEVLPDATESEVLWRGVGGELVPAPPAFAERIRRHLDFLRRRFRVAGHFRVATENTFPPAAGIASSASGFAAVTLAVVAALGLELPVEELSELARLSGSGSAARSVLGGYVEWPAGPGRDQCHARQILPPEHWNLRDLVAVVDAGPKAVSSLDGHRRAPTSPHFRARQRQLPARLEEVRRALIERDFDRLATVVEAEAIDLHCIAMTSSPPIFYWQPGTLAVLEAVRALRAEGIPACSTIDAGANVHVLCPATEEAGVASRLEALPAVRSLIRDGVGRGPAVEAGHLI